MASALTPFEQDAVDRAKPDNVHLDEIGIDIRFESMCVARGFADASARLDAVRQRVLQRLRDAGHAPEGWIG